MGRKIEETPIAEPETAAPATEAPAVPLTPKEIFDKETSLMRIIMKRVEELPTAKLRRRLLERCADLADTISIDGSAKEGQ